MKPKSGMPNKFAGPDPGATSVHPTFTRLGLHSRATTDQFDREGMGVAAKE
jgi:hypothetical protein